MSRAKAIPRWKNIYYISKNAATYISATFAFIIYLICVYSLSALENIPHDFFYCLIVSVQGLCGFCAPLRTKRPITRIFIGFTIMSGFWMNQIFSAYYFMIAPQTLYENQIKTIETIVQTNLHLASDARVLHHLSNKNEVIYYLIFIIRRIFLFILKEICFFSIHRYNWIHLKFAMKLMCV